MLQLKGVNFWIDNSADILTVEIFRIYFDYIYCSEEEVSLVVGATLLSSNFWWRCGAWKMIFDSFGENFLFGDDCEAAERENSQITPL